MIKRRNKSSSMEVHDKWLVIWGNSWNYGIQILGLLPCAPPFLPLFTKFFGLLPYAPPFLPSLGSSACAPRHARALRHEHAPRPPFLAWAHHLTCAPCTEVCFLALLPTLLLLFKPFFVLLKPWLAFFKPVLASLAPCVPQILPFAPQTLPCAPQTVCCRH